MNSETGNLLHGSTTRKRGDAEREEIEMLLKINRDKVFMSLG
jgi:hypothetical protein